MTKDEIKKETNRLSNLKLDIFDDKPKNSQFFKYNFTTNEPNLIKRNILDDLNLTSRTENRNHHQQNPTKNFSLINRFSHSKEIDKFIICNEESDRELWVRGFNLTDFNL